MGQASLTSAHRRVAEGAAGGAIREPTREATSLPAVPGGQRPRIATGILGEKMLVHDLSNSAVLDIGVILTKSRAQ